MGIHYTYKKHINQNAYVCIQCTIIVLYIEGHSESTPSGKGLPSAVPNELQNLF